MISPAWLPTNEHERASIQSEHRSAAYSNYAAKLVLLSLRMWWEPGPTRLDVMLVVFQPLSQL